MSRKAAGLRRPERGDGGTVNHGPGPRLRDGRLARAMTLDEAAELLKLDPTVLAALERDDFTAMPGTLYVRGYLASYARVLGISESEVVREYLAYSGGGPAPTLAPRRPIETQTGSSDTGLRWFSYGLTIGIVALVSWWGYERLTQEEVDGAPLAAVETTLQEEPTPQVESAPLLEPMAQGVETPPQPAEESEAVRAEIAVYTSAPEEEGPSPADLDQVVDREPELALEEMAAEETAVDEQVVGGRVTVAPVDELTPKPEREVVPPVPAASEVVALASDDPEREQHSLGLTPSDAAASADDAWATTSEDGLDVLEMSFDRDCWVEIRDVDEQRLVYGLLRAGSSRRVEGRAPFKILLGDSGAVEIRLNGEPTATSLYDAADGRPARFSLGGGARDTGAD